MTGRIQKPVQVVVLALVTLTLYIIFWSLRITREADQAGAHGSAPRYRRGLAMVLGALAALPLLLLGVVPFLGPMVGEAAAVGAISLMLLAWLVATVVGVVLLIQAHWRVWTFLRSRELARGDPDPIRPGLMLALQLIPIVNYYGTFHVLHRVQTGLNRLWAAPEPAPITLAAQPVAPAGEAAPILATAVAAAPVALTTPKPAVPVDPHAAFRPPPSRRKVKHTCKGCGVVAVLEDDGTRPFVRTCQQCGRQAKLAL